MSWRARLAALLGRDGAPAIRVRVILKGRIGAGWYDVDRQLALPAGATLATLIERAERQGIAMRRALDDSPHLRHTLMWNGDQVYLLGPLAGG